jgi:hypothetical protein
MESIVINKKICRKCKQLKPLNEYIKDKGFKDGHKATCKECGLKKKRSKEGIITKLYGRQRDSARSRNMALPTYTNLELREWAFKQEIFHKLYDEWVKSNYDKNLSVSFDRKDDYKSYSFDNLQIMTWKDNNLKSHEDRKSGRNRKMLTSIKGININTNETLEFYSIREASRQTNIPHSNIINCCKGKINHAGGYKWNYVNKK